MITTKTSIANSKKIKGDYYDKATILLKGIAQKHPFASGNHRTAMLCAIVFLLINKQKVHIKNTPYNSKTVLGIRERFYSDEEIKNWLEHGKIKMFKRFE